MSDHLWTVSPRSRQANPDQDSEGLDAGSDQERRYERRRQAQERDGVMNLTGSFIYRPVMTTLLMAAILIFGVMAYRSLPVADMPTVDFPTLVVTANLPGGSPETMASSVATPLEKQFSTIPGIESMNSVSTLGRTQITLQFNLRRSIDAPPQATGAQTPRPLPDLPPNMPNPPSYRNTIPADAPVLQLALTSETLPMSAVAEIA